LGKIVRHPRFSASQVNRWRRDSFEALTSEVVAGRASGPAAPAEWASALRHLTELSRKPAPAPQWWTPTTGYFGSLETRADPVAYSWDGMARLGRGDAPLFAFQLTLAGWGSFQLAGQRACRVPPGSAFIALIPSRHRYFLPRESPGWTFGWISIHHPYVLERMKKLVAQAGPLIEVAPRGPLAGIVIRLIRGAIKKDFRDAFEVELALFELMLHCEQAAQQARASSGEGSRLLEEVRQRVAGSLPKVPDVEALATQYGMSRTHFTHFFRQRTGSTPARFAAEVRIREATRLLLETRLPLKQIAENCGFADVNYFGKVFRRFHHMSPAAYRRAAD